MHEYPTNPYDYAIYYRSYSRLGSPRTIVVVSEDLGEELTIHTRTIVSKCFVTALPIDIYSMVGPLLSLRSLLVHTSHAKVRNFGVS